MSQASFEIKTAKHLYLKLVNTKDYSQTSTHPITQ